MRIGIVMAPLVIFGMLLRDKGPVRTFIAAGATCEERARRPASLKIESAREIQDAVRSGVLVAVGDGRYWARSRTHRRRRRLLWGFAIAVWVVTAGVAAFIWLPRG